MSPLEITVAVISGSAFIIMFLIASAKGDYQDLTRSTLENDKIRRNINNKK